MNKRIVVLLVVLVVGYMLGAKFPAMAAKVGMA